MSTTVFMHIEICLFIYLFNLEEQDTSEKRHIYTFGEKHIGWAIAMTVRLKMQTHKQTNKQKEKLVHQIWMNDKLNMDYVWSYLV